MKEDTCVCGGWFIEKDGWKVCVSCGGATTKSGKYLPPASGWDIPVITDAERADAWSERQMEEGIANFWKVAF